MLWPSYSTNMLRNIHWYDQQVKENFQQTDGAQNLKLNIDPNKIEE